MELPAKQFLDGLDQAVRQPSGQLSVCEQCPEKNE